MCLSNVYTLKNDQEKELFCKNVASVLSEGSKLTFTNVMGIQTCIDGEICKIDLVENCIFVRPVSI